ncbi:helix-turn-helix domain-containing protein [Micromonospora sp. CPCC 206061]|uniref:helix-turn-helix domain-containing protein n=1 Tax=Micromonospora sp. CPCC 206061 TaxID=3122410 RepID=UPI002FF2126E
MISPYVRRLRLAAELAALRRACDLSAEKLARAVGLPRTTISRLENARLRPDINDVIKILDQLGVTGEKWTQLLAIAREAAERGWWESFADEMGPRQALYANLEAGAESIEEYHLTLLPGLLQTPDFTSARAAVDKADWSANFSPARAVEARRLRQRMLHRPDGAKYSVVIDELAIRRPAAPSEVVVQQLRHIAQVVDSDQPRITVRVLPLDKPIDEHIVPRSGFSIYRYPDPGDPVVVAVDTVTDDLVHTHPEQTAHYLDLHRRLTDAALPPDESVQLLQAAARRAPRSTERAA